MSAIQRRGEWVDVWRETRWNDDDEVYVENPPDLTLTVDQMNSLVIEWLRGPAGPPGATGMTGSSG